MKTFLFLAAAAVLAVSCMRTGDAGVTGTQIPGRGIPDLYLRFTMHECWVELKNEPLQALNQDQWLVRWRSGQQAWAMNYKRVCGRCSYTVVALADGFLVIPMRHRFIENKVKVTDVWQMTKLKDIYDVLIKEVSV